MGVHNQLLHRKDRERYSRQQDILRAARDLFLLRGYHNTTLEQIARHAEFGKGTIYNYFKCKEDLLCGIVDQLADETLTIALNAVQNSGGTPREKLAAYAKGIILHARENADLFELLMREISRLPSESYEARIRHVRARGRKVSEILARFMEQELKMRKMKMFGPFDVAMLFDGMVRSHCMNKYQRFRSLPTDGVDDPVESLVSIFLEGVVERKRKG
jgi:AcrR family transcriptional regulator